MITRMRMRQACAGVFTVLAALPAAVARPPTSQPTSAPAVLPGPKYTVLRYDEDFSYLDGPKGSYKPDFFDPIKRIHLGQDWTLSLGGEARQRMESQTNLNFGFRDPTQDTYLLYREILFANLQYQNYFRIFVEGIDARVADRDLPQTPGMENTFDFNQLFADIRIPIEDQALTWRLGRSEWNYGRQRLIGCLDWRDAPNRFDGVKLLYTSQKLDWDFFWAKPVVFLTEQFSNPWNTHIEEAYNRKIDHFREQMQIYGSYATYKGIANHAVDLYFIGLHDDGQLLNPNGQRGDLDIYTIGSRVGGATGNFDYDVEGAGQWGQWAGDVVQAWMVGSESGYTFKNLPMTPRIGTGFDYATGDETPGDNSVGTFTQLFPTGHIFLGYIDLAGRQNIIAPNLNFTFKPLKDVVVKTFWYHFWLDQNRDALYNAGGAPIRRNVSGSSGNDVGDEFDITVQWQVGVHSNILVGYSHYWPSSFIETSGPSRDPDFFYLQYQFRF